MSEIAPTREQWKALYDLSNKFRRLECWRWMTDEQIFGVRNPETGEIGYCCIIGNLGEELGLIVYTGSDGLASYQRLLKSQDPADKFEDFLAQKCLSVTYDNREALEDEDRAVIDELGLSFSGARAWPAFRNLSPGYFPWFITAADSEFLRAAIDQAMEVCLRCKKDRDILTPRQPGRYLVRVQGVGNDNSQWTDQWLSPDPLTARPEIQPVDEVRVARIKENLKQGRATWEFSYALENMPVRESGRPYFPLVLLIADTRSGLILDNQTVGPASHHRQLAGYFLNAVDKAGMYPQEVMVEKDEAMVLLNQTAARLGIKLTKVRKCKESAKARKAFREHLAQRDRW